MSSIEEEKQYLANAEASGLIPRLGAYFKLSGPGWLQSAITLGGGSLASSLFLGVLAGTSLLWLQPVAIILGVIMLCAISHVTLSTGQSPFVSINREINPVLGWGWVVATIMANVVWCLPQFNLGTVAITQNLYPELNTDGGKVGICTVLLILATAVIWISDRGSKGAKVFDWVLKIMVGLIVIAFFGVVIKMAGTGELDWGKVAKGFVPDLSLISEPAETYAPYLEETGEFRSFWENKIVGTQRKVMIAAAATAVGINMTFFMPFVLLRRRWGREHRGLAKFDLWTALLIPYVVATSCVVIAAGSQFYGQPETAYKDYENRLIDPDLASDFKKLTTSRLEAEIGKEEFASLAPVQKGELQASLSSADLDLAAMLVRRDSKQLAASLESLLGSDGWSHDVFGWGVLGMALSTIIILMTINGHAVCEVLGKPHKGPVFLGGAMIAGLGVLGPFVWGDHGFWLAVPTSIIGFTLIPVAYLSFFLLINNHKVLGKDRPQGVARWIWNTALLIALAVMGSAAFLTAWNMTLEGLPVGRYALIIFGVLLIIGHFHLKNSKLAAKVNTLDLKQQKLEKEQE
jgi:hypothetical protein